MRDIRRLLLGVALVIALGGLYRVAMKKERYHTRPPGLASEALVRGSQNRWRSFFVIERPTLVEISRIDQVCKDGLCSYADGVPLPRQDLTTIFQDPAQSQELHGPPGPYRALLARACSHANNVEFCSKTLAPGFRLAACMTGWEVQLWTNAFAADADTHSNVWDFVAVTGGYGFTKSIGASEAVAACSTGPAFLVALPEPPARR